jgi:hypothetical protein
MAKKFLFKFLPLVFLCSLAFADEDLPNKDIDLETNKKIEANQRVSIYFHPGSLLWPALYLTIEYPLSEYNSIIINPSLWFFSEDFGLFTSFIDDTEVFRLGSGIGIRDYRIGYGAEGYAFGKGSYIQLMSSVHYLKVRKYEDKHNYKTYSGPVIDITFSVGGKDDTWGMFCDFGVGYRWANISSLTFFGESTEYLDGNIGFGFSF